MKVTGSTSSGAVRPRASNSAPSGGFDVAAGEESAAAASPARASAMGAVSTLDALLTLQEAPGPLERRRKAVRRASDILDALDDLKLNLLDEAAPDAHAVLGRLQRSVREARNQTDDPGLEDVLEQVEVRAAVELAKRETAETARTQLRRAHGENAAT
jgi:hypothetical protein